MKIINTILAFVCMLSLTACTDLQNWNSGYLSGGTEYLSNEQGSMVGDCRGDNLSLTGRPTSEAERFWQDNDLPKGTFRYVCKDGRAYLLNKVTDCQGNLIAKQSGGVEGFRAKYNLNNGNMRFTCNNGKVNPVSLSSLQCSGIIKSDHV